MRGVFKTARLVAEFRCKEQQSLEWNCHAGCVSAPDQTKPSALATAFFASGFDALMETNWSRSEEHTSELQSQSNLVCRLLLEQKKETAGILQRPAYHKRKPQRSDEHESGQ